MNSISLPASLPDLLLPWYRQHHRELPWRQDQEAYHIWVSEIMLQQTRVEAVKEYYARFLAELPTIADLAACDDDRLQKLWEGLGYYSRVRNLKKAAQVIMQQYGGRFPQTHAEILALPGIGDYTAGAICSIAFGLPTPAVDGNVLRVCARLLNDDTPIDTPEVKKAIRNALAEIYPADAGTFTQALMELGATVCGPNRKPECSSCPCSKICKACLAGTAEALPVKSPKREKKQEDRSVFIFSCDGYYALNRRPSRGLLAGLWEFPNVSGKLDITEALEAANSMGVSPRELLRRVERKHIFTHIQWNLSGFYMEVNEKAECLSWFTPEQIQSEAALPTAFRQFWEEIQHV